MRSRCRLYVASVALGGLLGSCAPAHTDPASGLEVLEGELSVLAALFRPGEYLEYHLRTDAGEIFILELDAPPDVEPNSRVTVEGESLGLLGGEQRGEDEEQRSLGQTHGGILVGGRRCGGHVPPWDSLATQEV